MIHILTEDYIGPTVLAFNLKLINMKPYTQCLLQ
jgi:hypothetical protein